MAAIPEMRKRGASGWRAFRPGDLPRAGATSAPASAAAALPVAPAGGVRILGLDPGSQRTGYALLECGGPALRLLAGGVINVSGAALPERLRRIYEAVRALVIEHAPADIAIERVFVHRNSDSALKLGQARGVALCAAVSAGASAHEYAPRAVKLAVTGYGAAEKSQVAAMITALLALSRTPSADAADAAAIALCHAQTRRLAQLTLAVRPRSAARSSAP